MCWHERGPHKNYRHICQRSGNSAKEGFGVTWVVWGPLSQTFGSDGSCCPRSRTQCVIVLVLLCQPSLLILPSPPGVSGSHQQITGPSSGCRPVALWYCQLGTCPQLILWTICGPDWPECSLNISKREWLGLLTGCKSIGFPWESLLKVGQQDARGNASNGFLHSFTRQTFTFARLGARDCRSPSRAGTVPSAGLHYHCAPGTMASALQAKK